MRRPVSTRLFGGRALSVLIFLVLGSALLFHSAYTDYRNFVEHQQAVALHSVRGARDNVALLIDGLKQSLMLFTESHGDQLSALVDNPNDMAIYTRIDDLMAGLYPDYFAFTVADEGGEIMYDDFGERVGDICLSDIKHFAETNSVVDIYIHPLSSAYHFDIILPWKHGDKRGIFFASFKANALARLLRNARTPGHNLLLLNTDKPGLVEVSAQGSREHRAKSFWLSEEEQAAILSTSRVDDTRWEIVDVPDEHLFSGHIHVLARKLGAVVFAFLVVAAIMLMRVNREEQRRLAAETALIRSNESLESRVRRRTLELSKTNRRLRSEIEKSRQLYRAVEQTDDVVVITDREGNTVYANPAFEQKTGFPLPDVLGSKQNIVRSGVHDDAFYAKMWKTLNAGDVYRGVFINKRCDESLYHEEKTITPLRDDEGNITHFVATGRDITERIEAEKHIEYLAYHDALTGLPNRSLLIDRLEHAMNHADRNEHIVVVMFLDLDRFKTINDSLGHSIGDQLLKIVAERLKQATRETDTIARLGGDEFALVMEGMRDINETVVVAQRILSAVAKPIRAEAHELQTSASIGVSIYPFEDNGVDMLLKHADTAMYRAKARGGDSFEFYAADMGRMANQRLEMESRLRGALSRDEFQLHYQPRVHLETGRVTGVEALLRWQNPELGMVGPLDFIPLLEETGQIMEVGEWVLSRACQDMGSLPDDVRLAVNLSPMQFAHDGLTQRVRGILDETGFPPERLDLEITESVLAHDVEVAASILSSLHRMGINIAVDDFGTGYSSLSYLKRFPIDCLKIDRSFVKDLDSAPDDAKLVGAIISMAHSLNMSVVTEGIETETHLDIVSGLNSEEGQGYLFSAPLPLSRLTAWLADREADTGTKIAFS